jgi:integrase
MPRIFLNEIKIRSLKAERQTDFWDTKIPGFGIRVSPKAKTFIVNRSGTRHSLGRYPDISLQDARKKLFALKAKTPSGHPQISFPDALDEFLNLHGATIRPRSKYVLEHSLRLHFKWTKNLDELTHHDVMGVIGRIGGKSAACHALKDIRTFFNWCIPKYLSHSPAAGIRMPSRYIPRERLLSDDEIKRIWTAAGKLDWYGSLVRLLILTGQRCNQILQLKEEWIKGDTVEFPSAIMKGGKSHVIPFGRLAHSLIPEYRPNIFQGKKKRELDKLTHINESFTLHDFRRYFASKMAEIGTPLHVTERLLAHRSGSFSGIVAVYQKYDFLPQMRDAMENYETALAAIISVEAQRNAA